MKRTPAGPPRIPPQPTWELRLTQLELLHLRDLFSILLPPEGKQTVSSALAEAEERGIIEARLWSKVSTACKSAKIPLDDGAPDFVVMMAGAPQLGIFKVNSEIPSEEEQQAGPDGDPSTLFSHPGDTDDGGAPEPPKASKKKPRKKRGVAKGKAR